MTKESLFLAVIRRINCVSVTIFVEVSFNNRATKINVRNINEILFVIVATLRNREREGNERKREKSEAEKYGK